MPFPFARHFNSSASAIPQVSCRASCYITWLRLRWMLRQRQPHIALVSFNSTADTSVTNVTQHDVAFATYTSLRHFGATKGSNVDEEGYIVIWCLERWLKFSILKCQLEYQIDFIKFWISEGKGSILLQKGSLLGWAKINRIWFW